MSQTWAEVRERTQKLLDEGKPQDAFRSLRAGLRFPGTAVESASSFSEALRMFAPLAEQMAPPPLADQLRAAAASADGAQLLFDLGYQLVEVGLSDVAATVLSRANRLYPREPGIVSELVCALENDLQNDEAVRVLLTIPEHVEQQFVPRYQLAFNRFFCGDVPAARALLPRLRELMTEEPSHPFMLATLTGFSERAAMLEGVSPLDRRDLRGWHFVLDGAPLLHLSPFGRDEGMNGRYGWLQDDESRCIEGIRRASLALTTMGAPMPPRVFALPGRESEILARATALVLRVPFQPWPDRGSQEPGLIVAYDLAEVVAAAWESHQGDDPPPLLAQLGEHHPGQILWSHVCCWTRSLPIAADLVTFHVEFASSPWSERIRVRAEGTGTEREPADVSPAEAIAARIAPMSVPRDAMFDVDTLERLCAAMHELDGQHAAGALRREGRRRRHWEGGPVRSGRFG